LLANNYGLRITDLGFWFQLIFICFFIVIAVFDLKHYLILDKVVLPASVLVFLYLLFETFQRHVSLFALSSPVAQGLIGAAIISGFFGLQYLISKGTWIGLGDVKLGIFLGLLFGLGKSLMLLLVGYCLGAVVGLLLIAFGKKAMSGKLPFGTFLGISGIIILLYGSSLIHWYLGLLGL
jgi:prepilin signal peptidase PulO-like enzyme (type II secretory pathway)